MARRPVLAALAVLAVGLTGAPAAADVYYEQPLPAPPRDEFWRDVVAPHAEAIEQILGKARTNHTDAQAMLRQDNDPTGEHRLRLLDDAYGMLRYARRLDPRQTDVLALLGVVAFHSGRTAAAIEALQAYLGELGPDAPVPAEIHVRLGLAYLQAGRTEDAIRQLRHAAIENASGTYVHTAATAAAQLGLALMNSGRMADAIDVVAPARRTPVVWGQHELLQPFLVLAVAYDRDEQISAAFEVIDLLKSQLQHGYQTNLGNALAGLHFVPAGDRHYLQALLYESADLLAEARTEWLIYAQPDAPFRDRALAHVAAIDELLAQRVKAAAAAARRPPPPAPPPPPGTIRPPHRRPRGP
jgi:tetratricopeptide (TPR) repeat protein